eukprot:1642692-Pleurochrysis_carterae.AAC.1
MVQVDPLWAYFGLPIVADDRPRHQRMADATCSSNAPSPPAPVSFTVSLASQERPESAGNSSRKRKSRPYLPLARVKNVRPTRLERRTKTGAQICCIYHIHVESSRYRAWHDLIIINEERLSFLAGLLLEPDFHNMGVNTLRPATQAQNTQTEDRVRPVLMLSQETQADFEEERIPRRWLEKKGLYAAESTVLVKTFFHHAMSCLRRPAGRADKGGSQQAAFSMEVPSMQPLKSVLAVCKAYPQSRYT